MINYNLKKTMLANSIKTLIKNNKLPENSQSYFDLDKLDYMLHFHEKQQFREWSCKTCGASVYGPNKLMVEHAKTHNARRELKENEIRETHFNLYR